ncbi:ParB domain protein nuclease, partial [candidate division TM7 genomosp. GTL1]
MTHEQLQIHTVKIDVLKPALYNPRKWSEEAIEQLTESVTRFGLVDPIIANGTPGRKNIVIGGHFRLKIAKDLGYQEVPVVYVDIADETKERELNLRLNRNLGEWNMELLAQFDQSLLEGVGFTSEELDEIFDVEVDEPEQFDLDKELAKLDIHKVTVEKGDVYKLGDSRLMCGDSTIEADFAKLMNGKKADMCMTDPPYILDYLHAKRHGKPTTGFGAKRDRRYLEADEHFETFARTGDIYCLFYERGFQLLKPRGTLSFITSNKWMRSAYGEKLRSYFVNEVNPLWLIDFGGHQVFDSATVDTNILIAERASFQNKVKTCVVSKNFSRNNMSVYFRQHYSVATSLTAKKGWVILNGVEDNIKKKIESAGKPLKEWGVDIYRGILT